MSTNPTPIYTPGLGLSVHRLRTSPTALGRLAAAFGVLGCVTLGGACSAPEPERQRVYRYETDLDRSVAREAQDVAAASDAYARGWTRLREEDFRGAAAEFTRASELDPASGRAFNNAGWAYYKLGETYRAAFAFKQAVERMPGDAVPLSNLGLTMEEAGRLDEAVRLHEAAAAVSGPAQSDALRRCRCRGRHVQLVGLMVLMMRVVVRVPPTVVRACGAVGSKVQGTAADGAEPAVAGPRGAGIGAARVVRAVESHEGRVRSEPIGMTVIPGRFPVPPSHHGVLIWIGNARRNRNSNQTAHDL